MMMMTTSASTNVQSNFNMKTQIKHTKKLCQANDDDGDGCVNHEVKDYQDLDHTQYFIRTIAKPQMQ